MSSISYVAAFRVYDWDDEIAELARRFFAAFPGSRQVVLADETRGPITIPGYEKISHTDDTACFGLPNHPQGRSLYFHGDYAIYFLQRALPDFDYYLLSEYDLAVNVTLEPMMRFAIDQGIDLIAHEVEPSGPDWFWHSHGLALSDAPWRSLLNLMVLSRRAIMFLLQTRRQLAQRFAAGEIDLWPLDEAFVPTALKSAPGMRFADLSTFADTENFAFRPWLSLHDPRANRPGSLVHSVLGGKRFIAALLAQHPPRDFFRGGSELREGLLSQRPFEDIVAPLRRALAKERDHDGVALLYEEAGAHGWPVAPTTDLALYKPAVSSSVSLWSQYQDAERDACGANSEAISHDYAFHTREEADPWWMVDLLGEYIVEEVAIVNRRSEPQRFRTFRIEASCDGNNWTTRFTQTDPGDVSSDTESPWRLRFTDPFPARYLRMILLGVGPLHLRRVQVFGHILAARQTGAGAVRCSEPTRDWPAGPTTDLAFCKPAVASSVSRWSRYQDPERDAWGANGEDLPHDYGFHTREEADPWWMVDLLDERLVEEVVIVNRLSQPQRFKTFRIETSSDGEVWTTRFTQVDPGDVSSDPESPWRRRFANPFPTRYLRLTLLGVGALHLRRVQVLGRILAVRHGHPYPVRSELAPSWPVGPKTDLACCKPAMSSSVSRWSRYQDPARDACGANGEFLPHDYGFHTEKEADPWWMVDLLDEYVVEEVAIVNRLNQSQRFRTFRIETSCDGEAWTIRFTKADPGDVSSDPELPWRLQFTDPFRARYLRITLLGVELLHLRRVQVFGRAPARRQSDPGD
jgi:hypothetical protein